MPQTSCPGRNNTIGLYLSRGQAFKNWKQWQKKSGYHVHTQKKIRIRNLRFRKIHFRERFRKAPFWGPSVFKKLRIRADTCDRFYVSGVEKLRFRKDPSTCARSLNFLSAIELYNYKTLYRNPMQVSFFGGTFDQLFFWTFFMKFSQKLALYFFYTMVQESQKWPKTQIKGAISLKAKVLVKLKQWRCVITIAKNCFSGSFIKGKETNLLAVLWSNVWAKKKKLTCG